MIIFKTTDRVPLTIGDIKIVIAPMQFDQKTAVNSATKMKAGKEVTDGFKVALLTMKYCVKEISGVTNADGSPFQLEFEQNGNELTDECANDLFQLENSPKLMRACNAMQAVANKEIELEGVTFDFANVKSVSKKN